MSWDRDALKLFTYIANVSTQIQPVAMDDKRFQIRAANESAISHRFQAIRNLDADQSFVPRKRVAIAGITISVCSPTHPTTESVPSSSVLVVNGCRVTSSAVMA